MKKKTKIEKYSNDAKIREVFGANRFLVKLLQTGLYSVSRI